MYKRQTQQTVDQMVDKVLTLPEGTRIQVMAPIVRQRKGTYQKELDAARRSGYVSCLLYTSPRSFRAGRPPPQWYYPPHGS